MHLKRVSKTLEVMAESRPTVRSSFPSVPATDTTLASPTPTVVTSSVSAVTQFLLVSASGSSPTLLPTSAQSHRAPTADPKARPSKARSLAGRQPRASAKPRVAPALSSVVRILTYFWRTRAWSLSLGPSPETGKYPASRALSPATADSEMLGSGCFTESSRESRSLTWVLTGSVRPARATHSTSLQTADLMISPPFPLYSLAFSTLSTTPATSPAHGSALAPRALVTSATPRTAPCRTSRSGSHTLPTSSGRTVSAMYPQSRSTRLPRADDDRTRTSASQWKSLESLRCAMIGLLYLSKPATNLDISVYAAALLPRVK
mmetsp:Transcript_7960/g.15858  ORF Transcript_7960/g.15858 Transcript_7960/m.15858 type:complete len:319 (+) Transcript_7960:1414-2370(+)